MFRCSATGLQLEGAGELLYGPRPWNLDFLRVRGLQPAGPLFSFIILSGSFQRLHLPHCCVLTGQFSQGTDLEETAGGTSSTNHRTCAQQVGVATSCQWPM